MRTGVSAAVPVATSPAICSKTQVRGFCVVHIVSTFRAVLPSSRSGATMAPIFGLFSHTVTLFQRTLAARVRQAGSFAGIWETG